LRNRLVAVVSERGAGVPAKDEKQQRDHGRPRCCVEAKGEVAPRGGKGMLLDVKGTSVASLIAALNPAMPGRLAASPNC
jgi:hypothetical protein